MTLGDARPRCDIGERKSRRFARKAQPITRARNRQFALGGRPLLLPLLSPVPTVRNPCRSCRAVIALTARQSQMKFGNRPAEKKADLVPSEKQHVRAHIY
ncbi:MAG: hypothetical protein ACREB0_07395 [Sphingopyxis sp.]